MLDWPELNTFTKGDIAAFLATFVNSCEYQLDFALGPKESTPTAGMFR